MCIQCDFRLIYITQIFDKNFIYILCYNIEVVFNILIFNLIIKSKNKHNIKIKMKHFFLLYNFYNY